LKIVEFIIEGTPVSQQTKSSGSLRIWKDVVRLEAKVNQIKSASLKSVKLTIIYFYDGVNIDVDNIIKPIQDALIGVAYLDDKQVIDVLSRKRNLNNALRITTVTPVLESGLSLGEEFLYITVEETSDEEID
jgi:crossover junction endodeoxyribonuclease RusA